MKSNKVVFKINKYGDFKGNVIAVFTDNNCNLGYKKCFALFEGYSEAEINWIKKQTRNAKPYEYSATKSVLEREYGYKLEVVNRI